MSAAQLWFALFCGMTFLLLVSLSLLVEASRLTKRAYDEADWEREMRRRVMYGVSAEDTPDETSNDG